MSEMEFDTDEVPVIERVTKNTQKLTTAEMAGVAAAAARRMPISDQIDIGRERGPVKYQSTVDIQTEEASAPLSEQSAFQDFRSRWGAIQTGFVNNPGGAVEQADELVIAVMKRLTEVFADERANLEQQWAKTDDISTEELRIALRLYRSFFDRLLSVY